MEFKMSKQNKKRRYSKYRSHDELENESHNIHAIVDSVFKKSYNLENVGNFSLPDPKSIFTGSPWHIEELQALKIELNDVKSKLNNYCLSDWHQHTTQRNKAKDVEWRLRRQFDPEFVTQAWCKFHEIISKYPLVPLESISLTNNKFLSVHLCEAPGAFITCLNHWLKTNVPFVNWDWLAMTLNPYYEGNSNTDMISDDRFIVSTLKNWYFGEDYTGNLMSLKNLDGIIQKARSKGKVNLVTADGSVNCSSNPGEQEVTVVNLHFCEIVVAISILERNGNFLLKMFTIFESHSINLIYFLSCTFQRIHFYKPVTSKEGNSEMYVVCLGFKGPENISAYLPILRRFYEDNGSGTMFQRNHIPQNFIEQMISCAKLFKNYQAEVIKGNIAAYKCNNQDFSLTFKEKRILKLVADKYISEFPIARLHPDLQIVGNGRLKGNKKNHWIVEAPSESFSEKQKKQDMQPLDVILMYKNSLQPFHLNPQTFVLHTQNSSYESLIVAGKYYSRIQNSRFCTVQISRVFSLIFQFSDKERNSSINLPSDKNFSKFESEAQKIWTNPHQIIKFRFNQVWNNNQTIAIIIQTLANLLRGHDLVLLGFLLLSHFNVGLLHLLSHCFERVEITTDEEIGYSITFRSFIPKECILNEVQSLSNIAKVMEDGTTILSITPIPDLYGPELYPIVVKLNNWIAKYCVDSILSENSEAKRMLHQ
ncbi:hypothetical protein QAD02_016824 [Eretmocerus hayati]|uniref:Uncharacterized protein n=1 Tax=Eretmocerus hayati TaxID=131215 RepID=A0ACC2PCK2_9HYME|nr:hypothetical protein QAD02_016824 [Eretmocerus hayati]